MYVFRSVGNNQTHLAVYEFDFLAKTSVMRSRQQHKGILPVYPITPLAVAIPLQTKVAIPFLATDK